MEQECKDKLIFFIGIFLFIMAWVVEFYFHYVSDFTRDSVGSDIFWRAEIPIAIASTTLFIIGIILFSLALYWIRKRRK